MVESIIECAAGASAYCGTERPRHPGALLAGIHMAVEPIAVDSGRKHAGMTGDAYLSNLDEARRQAAGQLVVVGSSRSRRYRSAALVVHGVRS